MVTEHGTEVTESHFVDSCTHPRTELRVRTFRDNSIHYARQCLSCGSQVGQWVPHEVALRETQGREVPPFDMEAQRPTSMQPSLPF